MDHLGYKRAKRKSAEITYLMRLSSKRYGCVWIFMEIEYRISKNGPLMKQCIGCDQRTKTDD